MLIPKSFTVSVKCAVKEPNTTANAGVEKHTSDDLQIMCVTEMLASKELVQQDARGAQQAALEEVCKRATRIALENYNQALVQYMCALTDGQTDMHTPLTNVNAQGKI